MPNGNFALGNTYDTVTRPVAWAVAKDCLARMGFPEEAFLDFIGRNDASLNKDSALDNFDNKNFFDTSATATLVVKEEPILERSLEASVVRMDNNPIFRDATVQSYVRPVYMPTKMSLVFKMKFTDEVQANRFRDDTWARANMQRHQQLHEITYHWQIPKCFLVILFEIYKLKETVDKVGDNFALWLRKCFDPRVDTVTNMAGKEATLIVPEDQVRVLGWYDFTGIADEPSYNKDSGNWESEWTYNLIYDKPVEAAMTYPLVVRQQLLDAPFRPTEGDYRLSDQSINPNRVNYLFGGWTNTWSKPKGIIDARYPDFDTWYPENGTEGCLQLWIGLTTISLENKIDVLSIDELGVHKLSAIARDFIMSDRQYVTQVNRSLFDIAVYANNNRAMNSQIVLGEDAMLRAISDISMEPVYHVVISVRRDLSTLLPIDIDRLTKNACKIYALLCELYPAAAAAGLFPKPSKRCTWTYDEWLHIVDVVSPSKPGLHPRPSYPSGTGGGLTPGQRRRLMMTVGSYHLITRRDADASANNR